MPNVTIEDVARHAGVSRMTVSRVINRSGYIKQETEEKVIDAIRELNYRPNMLAKSLVTKKSKTLAYVMINISDPFHNLVSKGIESVAYKKQYITFLCDTHSRQREEDYINMFLDNRIGGAIFHHLSITAEQIRKMSDNGVKCVLMDNETDLDNVSTVNSDNYAGGKMAGEYLVGKGHRKIGIIHPPLKPISNPNIPYENTFQFNMWKDRTRGFIDALHDAGLEPVSFYETLVRFEYAKLTMSDIIKNVLASPVRISALYCEDDIMAFGAMDELWKHGVRVPDDIAILGHDGLDMCRMVHPYLTTVSQPRYEMGRCAGEMLIDQIEGDAKPQRITLQPTIMPGETA